MLRFARRLLSSPVQSRRTKTIRNRQRNHQTFQPKFDSLEERLAPDASPAYAIGASYGSVPEVRTYASDGTPVLTFMAFEQSFTGGVRVAVGNFNGDDTPDIVAVPGPGHTPEVRVFDGKNGRILSQFTAYSTSFLGGLNVAVGDVNADGRADIVTAPEAGGGPHIRAFDGFTGKEVANFFAYDPSFHGGVRIAVANLDGSNQAEIITAPGQGGGPHIRVFDAVDQKVIANYFAYDPSFRGGVNVSAGYFNGDTHADLVTAPGEGGGAHIRVYQGASESLKANFFADDGRSREGAKIGTLSRDGHNADLLVGVNNVLSHYDGQKLTIGTDLNTPYISTESLGTFGPAEQASPVQIRRLSYDPTTTNQPNVTNAQTDADCSKGVLVQMQPLPIGVQSATADPIRYIDGVVVLKNTDLTSNSFSEGWGQSRSWSNDSAMTSHTVNGNSWVNTQSPYILQGPSSSLLVVLNAYTIIRFDLVAGSYASEHYTQFSLVHNSTNSNYEFTDLDGRQLVFSDFSTSYPVDQRGAFDKRIDPAGNLTQVTSRNTTGQPTEVQQSATVSGQTLYESYLSTYLTSGNNQGKLATMTLRQKVGSGSWSTVRSVEYAYYDTSDSNGNLGDLKTATIKDASGSTIDTFYYRYYTSSSSIGYVGGLKYVFTPSAYAQLANNVTNPLTASDTAVAPYASNYFEYDSSHRATKEVAAAAGCSVCSGGQGTYQLSYTTSSNSPGYNSWERKTVVTLPDGNQETAYTNHYGQVMLIAYKDTTTNQVWITFTRFNGTGQPVLKAEPSAMSGYDDTYADLVNYTAGNAQYIRDSAGLVETVSYGTSNQATPTTAGDVLGYPSATGLMQGEMGTLVVTSTQNYITHEVGTAARAFVANKTVYRNSDGTGGQTTSTAYTWQSGSFQPASTTTTLPTVTTAQNGPNSATSSITVFDIFDRPAWQKDQAGFITYTQYDNETGAITKQIVDVDTTQTTTFSNLPSGWSTPSGGGLHLTTTYEVDSQGRVTKQVQPNGRVDYTVYNDTNHEVRYYPGWNSSTNMPTGPTSVSRDDRVHGYKEMLTMSVTPTVSGGRPTGTESIGNLQSLSRSYRNEAGQVVTEDRYFDLSSVTYSTDANIGTLNTNYNRTTIKYSTRGWLEKTTSPLGTINRKVFDGQHRVVSEWVGTDDTPTTGYWSPSNLAGTDMVKVAEYEYDGGGVGDGNLTKKTLIPGGSSNRVTETYFDWRDRPVARKSGVEGSESTSTNRPITYVDYDNLNQITKQRTYDGDTVTITSTSGVPNAPSSTLLRAQSSSKYDELGRVYLSESFSVDLSSGAVGTYTLKTNSWYDARGKVIKTSSPGGTVQKTVYDGAGRVMTSYTTDGGGDTGYSDASNVTGDKVLQQSETAYDASGNVLSTITRQRFHDETGTGTLSTPTTGNHARVSYSANYYDAGDRLVATANYGTNGGSAWSRSGSVPTRSDTVLVTSFDYDSAGRKWKMTDPKGIESRTYYDALGRTTKTIENYVDGVVGDDNDKTTEYTYNAAGMKTLTAKLTGGGGQTTEWVYGVTTGSGSTINSYDIVGETHWPDPSTGAASSSQKDVVTVNALGQTLTSTDRNGTVHTLGYDVLGRLTTDIVTTLGTNIDGAVRRVETAYDSQGNAYLLTNYDATTGGSIVNQIQRAYNGLGQMTTEWQAHGSAVNTSTSPKVQYAYSEMVGGANHSRPTSMTYPNGRVISFNYGVALDDSISRLSALKDGTTTLESYDYLGLGTVVRRSHPQSGVDLSYVKLTGESVSDAGDQYTGLDRFGRVVDQRWLTSSIGVAVDRYQYAYDRNGNRTSKTNALNSSFNETYSYDNLNQLTGFGTTGTTKSWDYDALGNWDGVTTNGSAQTRTANAQNEITSISGATTPTYDANGNMTKDETGKQYVYDAWNRLVKVKDSGGTTIATYAYDAITRRVSETASSVTTDLYYSSQWQVLEERAGGNAVKSYVWSPVYVDAMVARDRDTDANGSLDERLYVTQDVNFNVTGLVNTSGTVVERFTYDPYGTATIRNGAWSTSTDAYVWQYLHQGGRLSGQSGLYSFRYREYSPTLGRWMTIDPINYHSNEKNIYGSNSQNPILKNDAEGLQPGKPKIPLDILRDCTTFANKKAMEEALIQVFVDPYNIPDPASMYEAMNQLAKQLFDVYFWECVLSKMPDPRLPIPTLDPKLCKLPEPNPSIDPKGMPRFNPNIGPDGIPKPFLGNLPGETVPSFAPKPVTEPTPGWPSLEDIRYVVIPAIGTAVVVGVVYAAATATAPETGGASLVAATALLVATGIAE